MKPEWDYWILWHKFILQFWAFSRKFMCDLFLSFWWIGLRSWSTTVEKCFSWFLLFFLLFTKFCPSCCNLSLVSMSHISSCCRSSHFPVLPSPFLFLNFSFSISSLGFWAVPSLEWPCHCMSSIRKLMALSPVVGWTFCSLSTSLLLHCPCTVGFPSPEWSPCVSTPSVTHRRSISLVARAGWQSRSAVGSVPAWLGSVLAPQLEDFQCLLHKLGTFCPGQVVSFAVNCFKYN